MIRILAVLGASLVLALSAPARADGSGEGNSYRFVIGPGHETEILALFEPYVGDDAVQDGWRVDAIRVQDAHIECDLLTDAGARATLTMVHPQAAAGEGILSRGFHIRITGDDPVALEAATRLAEAVVDNDRGRLWSVPESVARSDESFASRLGAGAGQVAGRGIYALGLIVGLLTVALLVTRRIRPGPVSISIVVISLAFAASGFELRNPFGPLGDLWRDMLAWTLVAAILLGFVAWRQLADAPRSTAWALLALTAAGALVRVLWSVDTSLDVWPYDRSVALTRAVWESGIYSAITNALGVTSYYTEFAADFGFVFALVTPLAVYCHGSQILDSRRAGLWAAVFVTFHPAHIRFSHSETAFIPSIVLSCLTFAMLHTALKDRNRLWRWVGTLAVVPLSLLVFATRPLNLVFAPLMVFTALYLVPKPAPLSRRLVGAALVLGSGVWSYLFEMRVNQQASLEMVEPLEIFVNGFLVLGSFELNTLIRPDMTPPILMVLAVLGVVLGLRQGLKTIVGFLVVWLLLFLWLHAFVLPIHGEMQSRYHLHLLVPFVFMAALGAETLLSERKSLRWIAVAVVAASPVLHQSFVRDVFANDQHEYEFVRLTRHEIPDGCTVLEFTSPPRGHGLRYLRGGARLVDGMRQPKFAAIDMQHPDAESRELAPEVAATLEAPPDCLYYYEGLPCWFDKRDGESLAPQCVAVRDALQWELVAEARFENRPWNEPWIVHTEPAGAPIRIALYRTSGTGPDRAAGPGEGAEGSGAPDPGSTGSAHEGSSAEGSGVTSDSEGAAAEGAAAVGEGSDVVAEGSDQSQP